MMHIFNANNTINIWKCLKWIDICIISWHDFANFGWEMFPPRMQLVNRSILNRRHPKISEFSMFVHAFRYQTELLQVVGHLVQFLCHLISKNWISQSFFLTQTPIVLRKEIKFPSSCRMNSSEEMHMEI